MPSDGKFATMFDRVRVCTLCFRIYKELENYYFKELRKNLPGANEEGNMQDEDTERLMNREVKNDKDDADPRSRVDKALGGLFIQVKKNMDKFAEISRSTTNVNSKAAKDLLFKTLDPKSSQAQNILGDTTATNKASTCLLYTSPSPRDRQKSRMPSSA